MSSSARRPVHSSRSSAGVESSGDSRCDQVCEPIPWPAASIRRTSSGGRRALRPTRKNVAAAPCAASTSSTCGGKRGSGPSSKVSATEPGRAARRRCGLVRSAAPRSLRRHHAFTPRAVPGHLSVTPRGYRAARLDSRGMAAPGGTLAASAIVPTAGRPQLIAACVRSIEACRPAPAEVVVVDQSGGGAVAAALAGTGARVLPCRGRGIALAMNSGLRAARHDVVLVTNDDCTVAPDWAAVAWRHLTAQPRGLVSGRVLPGGEGAFVPSLRDDPEPRDFSGERSFGALYAGNMALDRREGLALGGFDERRTLRLAAE